ncbi:MAG: response regulator transcription factor [Drouetiella hepatica Uher 2000/2452]|jgi:DNA-binding response OmpR family regulator|uniref:Response regulator transcription factor n=1 Tax=Drouetiella hepatica Uher 2000/2452 TaxID=904376 RepID=A0A951UP74_9CYAN|nr:response regulator transcription factor [Drouetiella hepatica Uher 2000/2452]
MYRILIVEDEPRIAEFLEKGLQRYGFETATVSNGNDVFPGIQRDRFDLILLDLGLPGKDGWMVLDELRHGGTTLPIVIVTAREGEDNKVESFKRGANDYIMKPFRFKELLTKVNMLLR